MPRGTSPLGAHWDPSRVASFGPYLDTLRGGTTFTEVVWCDVERTPGKRDWAPVDRIVDTARTHGIALDIKIRVGACWATSSSPTDVRGHGNKTESAMPADLNSYRAFVHDLAARYLPLGVRTYAIENEVNSASYWSGTPQQYMTLVDAAARELHGLGPSIQVADAGMSSTSYGYGIAERLLNQGKAQEAVQAFDTYFARRIGTRGEQIPYVSTTAQLQAVLASDQGRRNLAYLDVAATLARNDVTNIRQVHFYEPWQAVPLLLKYLDVTTPPLHPIEAWEVGSFWKDSTATEATRTSEMVHTVALLLGGGVRRVLWLPLATSASNRHGQEIRYGLLDPDGTVRPTGTAMSQLVELSRGATIYPIGTRTLNGVLFDDGSQRSVLVWAGQGTTTLAIGPGATVRTPGEPTGAPSSAPGVAVTSAPVLVTTREAVAQVLHSLG